MKFLSAVFGVPTGSWDNERVLGMRGLVTLRAINDRVHVWETTQGGARFRPSVIAAQNGEFCSICGRRSGHVVDHITPVSLGGSPDAVPNMQLLCSDCNLGKTNLRDRLLPTVISLETTSRISPRLRFKHLLLDSVEVDGRTRGVCRCGRQADVGELNVSIRPEHAAANLLNLMTSCAHCAKG
jgi:5-methylcytosine-specific restriction endonuclease McrA